MADVLTVAETVLNEGYLVTRQYIEVVHYLIRNACDRFRRKTHVTLVPQRGGKCVGVTDEEMLRIPCRLILPPQLLHGNVDEFVALPLENAAAHLLFRVLPAVLRNPRRFVTLGKCPRQGRCPR